MNPNMGTLYGIGVGPGDPTLVTLKALETLRRVPRIFAAGSTKNGYSIAMNIVRHHIRDAEITPLGFPMTKDKNVLQEAWERNARKVLEVMRRGEDAAFVTIGDPLTYSTFSYLAKTVQKLEPAAPIAAIPGITSYNAAAALANVPLCEAEESCHLISGAYGGGKLREVIDTSENVVMLKTYRFFDQIYEALEDLGLLDSATCVSMCGHEDETVIQGIRHLKGRKMPYLSLLIVKKGHRCRPQE